MDVSIGAGQQMGSRAHLRVFPPDFIGKSPQENPTEFLLLHSKSWYASGLANGGEVRYLDGAAIA